MGSRSDQLFNKRKARQKQEYKRKKATLSERARVLIVCEGEKTEPYYFNSLIHNLSLSPAQVKVYGECGSAPKSVVQFGTKKLESDSEFDQIYFVFDKDSHDSYDSALNSVTGLQKRRKYRNKSISSITSNPCFEIWFLMHFEPFSQPITGGGGKSPCENVIKILERKTNFKNYQKGNQDSFNLLSSRLGIAKLNSEQVLKQSITAGTPKHYGNPTTLVHKLVSALETLAKNQK